ncbi:MAG: hypothetical protein OXS30_07755 [Chloroflexota bacterium]|nr:hypothetical protein [Chloroflexota bacterium]
MEDVPRGTRGAGEDHLFNQPNSDPSITSDTISAAVEGYFRFPPIWLGEAPDEVLVARLNPEVHHAEVLARDLDCGIVVRALRDGTFLFDFTNWPLAGRVLIPGYKIPVAHQPHYASREHVEEYERAERIAVLRAQVMNVHQACLETSQWLLRGSSSGIGRPLTSADTLKGRSFQDALRYHYDAGSSRGIARSVANSNALLPDTPSIARHVIDADVVDHASALLDQILSLEGIAIVQIVEAIYLSAARCQEGRFGEAIVLVWGVCEQLLNTAWDRLLDSRDISPSRKKKLKDRDYTTSIRTEALELTGTIGPGIYQKLERARRARNRWAHKLVEPVVVDTMSGVEAAQGLLAWLYDIRLAVPVTEQTPSVPAWFIWNDG